MTTDEFRSELIEIREMLRPAMWCPTWAAAETTITRVVAELVGLSLGALLGDTTLTNEVRALGSTAVRALRLLNRSVELAQVAMVEGEDPTSAARSPLCAAMVLLDEIPEP